MVAIDIADVRIARLAGGKNAELRIVGGKQMRSTCIYRELIGLVGRGNRAQRSKVGSVPDVDQTAEVHRKGDRVVGTEGDLSRIGARVEAAEDRHVAGAILGDVIAGLPRA